MPPNKLPFEVVLHVGHEKKQAYPLLNFCRHEKETIVDVSYLVELSNVDLEFKPAPRFDLPSDARLYLEGLDGVSSDQVKRDQQGVYLTCPCYIPLYDHNEGSYPWIPGQYMVKVVWGDEEYFTILKVRAKNITDKQLEIMRSELEKYVRGLTIDLLLHNQGIGTSNIIYSLPERFYQYHLIVKEFPRLYNVILDIIKRPRQQAMKEHYVVPSHKTKFWDNRTLRWLNTDQGRRKNLNIRIPQFVLAPQSKIEYNLPENQWVKKIIQDLVQLLREIKKAIENTLINKKHKINEILLYDNGQSGTLQLLQKEVEQLQRDLYHCSTMQGQFWQILNNPLFKDISCSSAFIPVTPTFQRDGRYWLVYRFWQQLNQHSEIQVESAADYQRKRTDLLYEYWCFVKTIMAIKDMGFMPQKGWIFSYQFDFHDPIFIPTIKPGTQVTFRKGKWHLELIYDQRIPYEPKQSEENGIPLWSESENNRPDMRLDVYNGDKFAYTIILEVKYRRKDYIWNTRTEGTPSLWSDNMRQLKNYRTGLSRIDDYMMRGVYEVLALHPGDASAPSVKTIDRYRVTLLQITPGIDSNHFSDYLKDNIIKES